MQGRLKDLNNLAKRKAPSILLQLSQTVQAPSGFSKTFGSNTSFL